MLQTQINTKQALGKAGAVSQAQNTYFNLVTRVCASEVEVGYFVQRGDTDHEVKGVRNGISAEIAGIALADSLSAGYRADNAKRQKGETISVLNVGNCFLETTLKCSSGDYVCLNATTGDLMIESGGVPSTAVSTGFRVVKGHDKAGERGVIEISTAGVAGASGGSSGGGISPTLFYTKAQVDEIVAARDLSKYYTKIEANSLLLDKVDSSSLKANYTDNVGLTSLLAYKADKTALEQAVKDRLNDQATLQQAVTQTSTTLTTQMQTLTSSVNEVKTQLMAADAAMQADIEAIEQKIPSDATGTNQLASKEYVKEQVQTAAARAISADADGNGFASLDALKAGKWYSLGVETTPTANDYAVVKKDATHSGNDVRYNYDGAVWVFFQEFTSGSGFTPTTAQSVAMDSGINATLVTQISTNKNAISVETTARQNADTNLQVLIGNETTARQQGDNDVLSQAAAGKAELELKIGDLNNLTVGDKTSVVNCINSLATAYAKNFVAKTGDTMTGELQIETAGSGDLIRLVGGGKGVTFSMDANTGHLAIRPESAPTTGFDMTATSFNPRSNAVAYDLGNSENTWDNGYIENLKSVKTLNGTAMSDLVLSVSQVKALVLDMIYPIGAVLHSFDYGYDPNTAFSGTTWEKISEGVFLEATTTNGNIGATKEAGLPNIEGYIENYDQSGRTALLTNYGLNCMGAFSWEEGSYNVVSTQVATGSGSCHANKIRLNASNSSSVYGRSNTVQPKSVACFIWKRVA